MKLLHRDKVLNSFATFYSHLCDYFIVDTETGSYFVFSDDGDLRGISDKENKEAYTLDGKISIQPESYKVATVTEVKFLSVRYLELSPRLKEKVQNMVRSVSRITKLDKVNPRILFSLSMEPLYMDGTRYGLGIYSLPTHKSHISLIDPAEVLPVSYVSCQLDFLWDMAHWIGKNIKNVEANFMNCLEQGRQMEGKGIAIAATGHLLTVYPVLEACSTHYVDTDVWVKNGFKPIPLMVISAGSLKHTTAKELYEGLRKYIEQGLEK